jgi:DNA-binding response OmpR family regulator/nitrogen-specific signal transduction histidine kinase
LFGSAVLLGFFRQKKARRQLARQNEIIRLQAEELKKLEELKSRFFANVSHELRTPLSLMLGPVHSILKRMENKGLTYQLLQLVQRNGKQLQKLVNEILDLAKLEAGKLEITAEPVPFLPFLHQQITQFEPDSSFDKTKFILDYQADPDLILSIDKNKLEKIIRNFLSNAIKYTPKGGNITLRAKDLGAKMEVSVSDTGTGIHPDDMPYIFDRFYQSRQINAKTEGGTGIGLSLCKELALLLGGDTWATSEPGKGSIFYFVFPRQIDAQQPMGEKMAKTVNENSNALTISSIKDDETAVQVAGHMQPDAVAKSRILIVEDNPDLRKYLQFILSDFDTITAENGLEALKIVYDTPAQKPQLILSDIMMPVMDGFELLEKLKSDDRSRHLPVIMLTAKANLQTKLQALRVGVDDYLTKPFEEEEIIARIENLLYNYHERMAYFTRQDAVVSDNSAEPHAVISTFDDQWLQNVESVFFKHISESRFNMEWAASVLLISKRQLDRRLLQLTGLTSAHYLREIRLQKAREYLQLRKFSSIKEVAHQVGFNDTAYFSTLFHKRFGTLPSTML